MRKLIFALLVLTLFGCGGETSSSDGYVRVTDTIQNSTTVGIVEFKYQLEWAPSATLSIVVIDSCQWLSGWAGGYHGGAIFTHRPRCKFCKERLKETLKNPER